jgi:hypothetical protein
MNQPAPYSTNPNSPFFGSGARRLAAQFPGGNLAGVAEVLSEGRSNYNGLQTAFQRRFTKGLSVDANYTWAKGLADNNGFSQEGSQEGFSNADPFRIHNIDYGIAENDIQNRFALSAAYELQYGKNFTGVKKFALAGYHINTISVWQTGKPFTILNGGGNNDNTTYTSTDPVTGVTTTVTEAYNNRAVPNNNGGQDRPNQVLSNARGNRSLHQFFNTAAFAPQPTGTVGTARRNSLFGPNFRHVDLSLFKDFPVKEGLNVQFRAESYNISNTPSYIIPLGSANTVLGNPAFGTVTNYDSNYTPRLYQFALKIQF